MLARAILLQRKPNPRLLPNLAFWFDPSDANSVTLNGDDVSQINDKGTALRHAAQGTAAAQPLYVTGGSGINNRNVIAFTAANNDALPLTNALGLARNVPGLTVLGIARIPTLGAAQRLFSILTNGGVARFFAFVNTTGVITIQTRRLDADSVSGQNSTATVTAATAFFFAFGIDYVNAQSFLQVDAVTRTQAVAWTGGGNSEDTDSSGAPALGRVGSGTLDGDVGEVAGYQRYVSALEIERLRVKYFKPKWGLA